MGTDDMKLVYISPYSLLVYTPKTLIRIYCPFTVKPTFDLGELCQNERYAVDKVMTLPEGYLAFQIKGEWYYYRSLQIVL